MLYLTTKLHIPYYSSLYSKTHSSRSPSPTTPHYTPLHPTTPHYTPLHPTTPHLCLLWPETHAPLVWSATPDRGGQACPKCSGQRLRCATRVAVGRATPLFLYRRPNLPAVVVVVVVVVDVFGATVWQTRLQSCEIAARNGALSPVCGRRRDRCGRRLFLIRGLRVWSPMSKTMAGGVAGGVAGGAAGGVAGGATLRDLPRIPTPSHKYTLSRQNRQVLL